MSDTLQFVVIHADCSSIGIDASATHDKLKCVGPGLPRGGTDLIPSAVWYFA